LSSVNLAKYDEWKDTDLIYTATWFLDGVLEEFIQRAKNMRGFENSVRSAEKGRALGLVYLDGTHIYNKKVCHLKVFLLNLKLVESSLK
jgi:ribonucleoside-diphosphate reductase alpha chain